MDLSAHIDACLQRHRLAQTTGIVAVSGGPDSVAARASSRQFAATRESLNDWSSRMSIINCAAPKAMPTKRSCKACPSAGSCRHLICCTRRIDVAALAEAEHENLEAMARRERYRWFTQLAHEKQAAWIATGHSADDQAETVLFRLLRGSGVLGLGGIPECRPLDDRLTLVRPLLTLRRAALLDYLQDKQIPYRVDSSNRDLRFTRNRLRLELLPQLQRDFNPAIVDVLCGLAEQARELHADIAEQAVQLQKEAELPRAGDMLVFSATRLRGASSNLVREMFRLVWQREGWPMGDMDFERWNRVVEIVHQFLPACDFPGGIHVRRVGGVVQIHRKPV